MDRKEFHSGMKRRGARVDGSGRRNSNARRRVMEDAHGIVAMTLPLFPVTASEEARSEANQEKLWKLSSQLAASRIIPNNL
jgi:hypothetical protein